MKRILCIAALVGTLSLVACGGSGGERQPGPPPAPGPAPVLTRTTEVGGSPAAVATGLDAVWVVDNLGGRLLKFDPRARRIQQRVEAGQAPVAVAVGSGGVWVASADGTVRRFDPATGARDGAPARVPGAAGIAVGEGSVWVTSQSEGTVTRLDPATGRRIGRAIEVGPEPTDVAVGGGGVWVANSGQADGTISRIDPETTKAGEPIDAVDGQVFALTYGEGGVWVAGSSDEIRGDRIDVLRIDPSSSEVDHSFVRLDRPGLPVRLAAGAGAVWVTQAGGSGLAGGAGSGTIARLDPAERRRLGSTARIPGAPTGVAVGEGAVWVVVGNEGGVIRVDPPAGSR